MKILSTSVFPARISKWKINYSSHFGGRATSSSGKSVRMGKWVMNLSQEKDKVVRQAGFLALWLSKFLFSEFLGYGVKYVFFHLAIRLAQGAQYPLAPMFLGHIYSQLDLLHGDEVEVILAMLSLCLFIVPFSRYSCGTVLLLFWQSVGV